MNIFPSILEPTADALTSRLTEHAKTFDHVQIDIADGKFVEGKTVGIDAVAEALSTFPKQRDSFSSEFHLMVQDIDHHLQAIQTLTNFQPETIIVHIEPARAWCDYDDHKDLYKALKSAYPYEFGVAINPSTHIHEHLHTLLEFPMIQIMTIEPGAQGQPFMPSQLNRIKELRVAGFMGVIQLDGAINTDTFPLVLHKTYWPDAVCPGSYFAVNSKEELKTRLSTLEKMLEEANAHRPD